MTGEERQSWHLHFADGETKAQQDDSRSELGVQAARTPRAVRGLAVPRLPRGREQWEGNGTDPVARGTQPSRGVLGPGKGLLPSTRSLCLQPLCLGSP